jgi:hydroxymethylbilane synthase
MIRIGTRSSGLARWQTEFIADRLRQQYGDLVVEMQIISTSGDRDVNTPLPEIGGKGVFTAELEDALRAGHIDCAVHSLKDLPTADVAGLIIGAIPERGSAGDVLISRNRYQLVTLPQGATIGVSSRRRSAQLLRLRPDLKMLDIRGNVDTRVAKALVADSPYDAIVLAQAGIERLNLHDHISQILPMDIMLCAPGQGALAVQCRDDDASRQLFAPLNHTPTRMSVLAERSFLKTLESGCSVPVAAYGHIDDTELKLRGRVISADGREQIDVSGSIPLNEAMDEIRAIALGEGLAHQAIERGAERLLAKV